MASKTYKLGELIEITDERNSNGQYGIDDVRGISNMKTIMPTKADVDENVITKFYVVQPNDFIYNPRTTRMGDKVGLGFNDTGKPLLFSFNNIAFRIKPSAKNIILPRYLYIYYNRSEFDRYAINNSWGSATELFTFEEMCDIDITLPDLKTQEKYVEIYETLVENQNSYERGLDDLKLTCDAYIEELRRKMPYEKIGKYITNVDERNTDCKITNVKGLTVYKQFIETKADMTGVPLSNYKIVRVGEIAYVSTTNRNGDRLACGLCEEECIISTIYDVIKCKEELLPEYLFMWFKRDEFDRWCRYNSWGSARETIAWEELIEYTIPIPKIEIQKAIIEIFNTYNKRKKINETLKSQIKDICPILIKGSLEETKEA